MYYVDLKRMIFLFWIRKHGRGFEYGFSSSHIGTGVHSLIHLFNHLRYMFESLPCAGVGLGMGYKGRRI